MRAMPCDTIDLAACGRSLDEDPFCGNDDWKIPGDCALPAMTEN
jgi:hypothetical protein